MCKLGIDVYKRQLLTLRGEMKGEGEDLVPYLEGGVAVKSGSTNAAVRAYGEVPLVTACLLYTSRSHS